MVNGVGVLAWGVGGIEAEAAMLGQPVTMLIPEVVGFRLTGKLREGVTATDLVLPITQMLRKKGVVGKFVEFYGAGLSTLPVAVRTTIGNMSPEYGSTIAIFPIDDANARRICASPDAAKNRSRWSRRTPRRRACSAPTRRPIRALPTRSNSILSTVEPNLAGPRRPQDRVPLRDGGKSFEAALKEWRQRAAASRPPRLRDSKTKAAAERRSQRKSHWKSTRPTRHADELRDGSVVIAAITSCTNTSNPAVLIGAGLLANKAVEHGLQAQAVGEDVACAGLESRHRLSR